MDLGSMSDLDGRREVARHIEIDHGASYGQTIFVEKEIPGGQGRPATERKMPSWWQVSTVQWDLDLKRFYQKYIELMSRAPRQGSGR